MSNVIPPYIHDTMMACSRKLFNAAQDGDIDYAFRVMTDTIGTLQFTKDTWKGTQPDGHN